MALMLSYICYYYVHIFQKSLDQTTIKYGKILGKEDAQVLNKKIHFEASLQIVRVQSMYSSSRSFKTLPLYLPVFVVNRL